MTAKSSQLFVFSQHNAKCGSQRHPVKRDLLAGASAAVVAVGVLHPIDTLKTNIHLEQGKVTGIKNILATLGNGRGIIRQLYKGFGIIVLGSACASAVRLAVFEYLKRNYVTGRKEENPTVFYTTCSCLAGLASSVIYVPFESTKQRLQSGMYPSTFQCILDGWKRRGFRSFYLGWTATVVRDLPFTVIELTVYERLKDWWRQKKTRGRVTNSVVLQLTPVESMFLGCLAAGFGGFLTCPLDVVKTRVMTSPFGNGGIPLRNIRRVVMDIAKREGIFGFFRGVVPRIVQLGLMGSIFFTTFETCKNWWNRYFLEYEGDALGM
ncbi:hypothetical protein GAYE_SCF66G6844 [Galdieria yellowstonensis]|uniref:Mitochondrial carrier protein n=1 Tax=Galdieria yellowstonensis TaxID=3028027 RepID=A0AAV9INB1_9RHOD|nr:hypothetical protein GAYE_SCF66G6844 [Galdieria yellowstonensis]